MELIDTFAEKEIREFGYSTIDLRKMSILYMFRNSDEKRVIHDGYHPFTTMSCHVIVHRSGGKRVELTQNFFRLYIDMYSLWRWEIERTRDYVNCPDPTLEEAAGYCNEEKRRWN